MSTYAYTADLYKEIKIETNDTNNSIVVLAMRAKVFEMLKASPRLMNFGRMGQDKTESKILSLKNVSKKSFKITKLDSSNPGLISVSPTDPFMLRAGETKNLVITMSIGKSTGFVGGFIEISTDLPYLARKTVQVRAEVAE